MSFLTRRKFLITGGVAAAGALALGEDAVIREPQHPELVRIEMSLSRLPPAFDGFTIAHLSDFHYDEVLSVVPIRKAIEIVNGVHADVVVLTGDFVTVPLFADTRKQEKDSAWVAEPCAKLLADLRSRGGSFAVLGNHDVGSDPALVTDALQSRGISVLCNRSYVIEQGEARLWLCGLDSIMAGEPRIEVALKGIPKDEPVILLVHEPDFANEAARYPVDVQLSGHSHGGQIWLPGIGAPWLPPYAREYPRGRYAVGSLQLYTNIGLGTIRMPIRLNCTPEITLVTLHAGKANKN